MTSREGWRTPLAVSLILAILAWTIVRVSAAQVQRSGRQAYWAGKFHTALSRYLWLARLDPFDLPAADGQMEVLLAALEDPAVVAPELGMDFSQAARSVGEVLRRLVEAAPLRPDTWGGVADFFGAVKIENQRHRVYALEEISPHPEENLEPEDVIQIRALERSTRVDPNGVYYWDTLGDFCWNIGLRGLAKEAYGEAVTLLPEPSRHLFLAPVGRPRELEEITIRAMERALEPPRNADPEMVFRNLGLFLLASERYAEARRAFEKAEASALSGNYISFQAFAAAHEGQMEEAIRLYRRALAQDHLELDGRFRGHLKLGELLEKAGRQEEAAREVQSALSLKPRDPRALLVLGKINEKLGLLEAAEDLFARAAENSEEPITPLVNLMEFYRRTGRPAEALVPARKLAELQPEEEVYRELIQQLNAEIAAQRAR